MVVLCAGCERPIVDRFLLNVLDRAWHTKCVHCEDCKCSLSDKCFSRDGKLYCKEDFFRRYGTKCGGCSLGISPNDLVRRARNKVFHLKCFTCMVCRKQLSTGEELYVLDENKFICKEDYINSKYQGYENEDGEVDLDSAMLDKLDDGFSDKTHDDDDSRDSGLPTLNNSHNNNSNNSTTTNGPTVMTNGITTNSTLNNGVTNPPDNHCITNNNNNNNNHIEDMESEPPSPIESTCTDITIKQEKNNNKNEGTDEKDSDSDGNTKEGDDKDGKNENNPPGSKRRGPRTTIKAKQLEVLKAAFNATPKPTRHIREQLAQETGLNMRVIQVWFQNRRSKERRMKQLSALGARRQFFSRNPRARMRALRPEDLGENPELMGQPGFNYFGENGEFYPGYPGYPNEYFPGQQGDPGNMNFLPPGPQGTPPLDQVHPAGQMVPESQYLPNDMSMPPTSSPEPLPPMQHHENPFTSLPPRSLPIGSGFNPGMHHPHEMPTEAW